MAISAQVEEAEAVSEKLAGIEQHSRDAHAAAGQVWEAKCLAEWQDDCNLNNGPLSEVKRLASLAKNRVAALCVPPRYDGSGGRAS